MLMENTAGKIAAATLRILEKEGAGAVSMRRVAALVGITPMAVYHHFPDRESLLRSVTDREFEKLVDYMRKTGKALGSRERLLSSVDYYIDYAFAHPRVFDYVFSQSRPDARRFPADFHARRSPTMNVVADIVAAAMEDGTIAKGDVWEIAFEFWALVHGYIALYRAGRIALGEKQMRGLCRRGLERLVDGL
ncbi:MAG TPA: TetR/AcrR family transcriptional regulator [Rhizomicrobium sp.]|jgi:AcrR family transcriptional regulator